MKAGRFMFAIVKIGNQQFKVKAGDFIRAPFQKLSPGDKMDIPVLAFGSENSMICEGSQLKKSKVKAVLLRQSLANKIIVFKKKRRKGYRRTQGHRQKITELRILELHSPDGKISKVESKTAGVKTKGKATQKADKPVKASSKREIADKEEKAVSIKAKKTDKKIAVKVKTQKSVKEIAVKKAKTEKSAKTEKKQAKKGD